MIKTGKWKSGTVMCRIYLQQNTHAPEPETRLLGWECTVYVYIKTGAFAPPNNP